MLRILEAEHGAQRLIHSRDTRTSRGIEIVCDIGDQRFALEHTLIEPFPDSQRDFIAFGRVFDPAFAECLADVLKPDLAYTLSVDVGAFLKFKGRKLPDVRGALMTWARGAVARLPEPPRDRGRTETRIHAMQPETPVRVTLACYYCPKLGGRLLPERRVPHNLESLRRARLLKALETKGPKLQAASADRARTVLVAENFDFAITNESLLVEAFDELCMRVPHPPHDIYVVDTRHGLTFRVTQVRSAGRACLIMGDAHSNWEYKATDLAEV